MEPDSAAVVDTETLSTAQNQQQLVSSPVTESHRDAPHAAQQTIDPVATSTDSSAQDNGDGTSNVVVAQDISSGTTAIPDVTSVVSNSTSSTTTGGGRTTAWEEGFHLWQQTQLAHKMSTWDEAYSLVVAYKESTASEKHKFVSTAKEFVRDFNVNPSRDVVEGFLKFLKKYISGLFGRAEVAEDGFVAMYQTFSMVPDPSPLFLSAHVEWAEAQREMAGLHAQLTEAVLRADSWQRRHTQLETDLAGLREELHRGAPSSTTANNNNTNTSSSPAAFPFSKELRELRSQMDDLTSEKQQLIQICHRMESEQAVLTEQKKQLEEDLKSAANSHVSALQKLEERLSRGYRENSALVDEVAEAHERIEELEGDLLRARADVNRQKEQLIAASAKTAHPRPRSGSGDQADTEEEDTDMLALLQDTTKQLQQRSQELTKLRGDHEGLQRRYRELQVSSSGGEVDDALFSLDGHRPAHQPQQSSHNNNNNSKSEWSVAQQLQQQQLTQRVEARNVELLDEVRSERRMRRALEGEASQLKTRIVELERSVKQLEAAWKSASASRNSRQQQAGPVLPPPAVRDTWRGLEGLLHPKSEPIIDESTFSLTDTDNKAGPSATASEADGESSSAVLVVALQKQRDMLKQRLADRDAALQRAEAALADMRHERDVLLVEKGVLERHISEAPPSGTVSTAAMPTSGAQQASVLDEPRQRAALLASVKSSSALSTNNSNKTISSSTTAVAIGEDHNNQQQQQQQIQFMRRRRKVVQTLRSFGDQVAILLANMLVYSYLTRMALVIYILCLHGVVILTTYTMAFRNVSAKYGKTC